jgi:hypothetical protein
VQPKNITFPTDAKLVNRAREKLVKLADRLGVKLRQSYKRVGKLALIMHQRYAHARQFKRANRMLRKAWKARHLRCEQGVGCGLPEQCFGGSTAFLANIPRVRQRHSRTRADSIGKAMNRERMTPRFLQKKRACVLITPA